MMSRSLFGVGVGLLLAGQALAETIPPGGLMLRSGVAISSVSRAGRSAFRTDPVEAAIVAGNWKTPRAGDTLLQTGGNNKTWETVNAGPDGSFTNAAAMRGGYLSCTLRLDGPQVVLLNATGHGLVYVNGEPHTGDTYQWGINSFPVLLRAGENEFLFSSGRGRVRAELKPAKAPLAFHSADMTLPDLLAGEKNDVQGAVIVVNATTNFVHDAAIRATAQGGKLVETALPSIPPLAIRKVPFRVTHPGRSSTNQIPVSITLLSRSVEGRKPLDTTSINLRLRGPADTFKTTFLSEIDGSLQYYAVRPAVPSPTAPTRPALFLSLHGASVEAMGQADAYSSKNWGIIAAPTNRRPYGFDWEDWGRRDAIEVLELAQARFKTDPRRVYLTGHSMGGHGTWQVGVTYPDRFAALGPSAGWISFWSYAGARREENPSPVRAMFDRALSPSDTLALATNYSKQGIYILHGDKDDNVPVSQARTMREELGKFHHDFMWHEQPGAGHWWDSSDEPGAECMDWAPMYDLFARRQLPAPGEVRDINFSTANPGVSASCHWLTIHAQTKPLVKSAVNIRFDPGQRRFSGTTENVETLALDVTHAKPGGAFKVELDRQSFTNVTPAAGQTRLWFKRDGDKWQATTTPGPDTKGPRRYGPFKEAFGHRMMFVYATRGTPEENAWALAKARFDAETFWYRGNGAVDVVPDHAFDPRREPDRGVILYGNADNNAAWTALLGNSPVQVRRGVVTIGSKELRGDDLACLFLRPRPGSDVASVAVVGGSGPAGLRLTDRAAYFTSGVAYPDCAVFDSETLVKGFDGVRAAGFFGNDWSIGQGEFVWRD